MIYRIGDDDSAHDDDDADGRDTSVNHDASEQPQPSQIGDHHLVLGLVVVVWVSIKALLMLCARGALPL